ncbi:hypothetical protein BE11_17005 [Sorangium cellulosum]|nr:hypothetical protein BE11_17005 [Sorangium cellulosum]
MKAAKILARLAGATAQDAVAELRRAGQALGDELPRRRLDELRALRAGLERIKYANGSFELGYKSALQDVMTAYEAAAQRVIDEEDAQSVILNEGWREVLLVLRSGAKRPADVAKDTGKAASWVTRALQRLREAGLVEGSDGADGRTKPQRLTPLGARVLARLPDPVSGDLRRGIQLSARLDSRLASCGKLSVAELLREAASVMGQQQAMAAFQEWIRATTSTGATVCDSPATVDLTELGTSAAHQADLAECSVRWREDTRARLANLLYGIIRDSIPVPSWVEKLRTSLLAGTPVFVRTKYADVASAWRLLLLEKLAPPSDAVMHRTITDGDLVSGALRSLDTGAARPIIIYDEPAVIGTDPDAHPFMRHLMDNATEKWCIAADRDGRHIPAGFQHMPLDECQP